MCGACGVCCVVGDVGVCGGGVCVCVCVCVKMLNSERTENSEKI